MRPFQQSIASTCFAILLTPSFVILGQIQVRTLPDAVISNHPAAVADAAPIPGSPPSPHSMDNDFTSSKRNNYPVVATTSSGGDYRGDDSSEPQPLHRATAKQLDKGSRPSDLFLAELGRLWQQAEAIVAQVVCDTECETAAELERRKSLGDSSGGDSEGTTSSRDSNQEVAAKSKLNRKRQISTSTSVKTGAAESAAEASWFEHVRK